MKYKGFFASLFMISNLCAMEVVEKIITVFNNSSNAIDIQCGYKDGETNRLKEGTKYTIQPGNRQVFNALKTQQNKTIPTLIVHKSLPTYFIFNHMIIMSLV